MNDKTINLAPSQWRRLQPRTPWPSVVVTLVAVTALIAPTLSRPDAIAFAEEKPTTRVVPESWTRIPESSPDYTSYLRLERWYAWDEILALISQRIGSDDSLGTCSYSAESGTFEITGRVKDITRVQALGQDLGQWPFLTDFDPYRLEGTGRHTEFGLRMSVAPAIRRQSP
ncbi:MAG: hypothetical protein KDC38_02255 [Planctomycetes bacterium]|nr:hypothetical protein [Planctomycetota bacterium]